MKKNKKTADMAGVVRSLRDLRRFLKRSLLEGRSCGQLKQLAGDSHLLLSAFRTVYGGERVEKEDCLLLFDLSQRIEGGVLADLVAHDDESLALLPAGAISNLEKWMDGQDLDRASYLARVILHRCSTALEAILLHANLDDGIESFNTIVGLVGARILSGVIPVPVCLQGRRSVQTKLVEAVLKDPRADFAPELEEWKVYSIDACRAAVRVVEATIEALTLPPEVLKLIAQVGADESLVEGRISDVAKTLRLAAESQNLLRWLPSGGVVRFCPCLAGYDAALTRIGWVAVEPDPDKGIPTLNFQMMSSGIGPYGFDEWHLSPIGEVIFPEEADSSHRALRLLLTLMIMEEVGRRVLGKGYDGSCGDNGSEETESSRGPVWPHFQRLPRKFRRDGRPFSSSEEALERALEMVGYLPPEGMTFSASPPIRRANGRKNRQTPQFIEVSSDGILA